MRTHPRPAAAAPLALAIILSCLAAPGGQAQVPAASSTDLPASPTPRIPAVLHANGPHQTLPASRSRPGVKTPPPGVPPAPVLPPPLVVPVRPPPPPEPPSVNADAPDIAQRQPDGMRVTFGAGRADLNPATESALRALPHDAPAASDSVFTVTAYAAGSADDPSTPRRLSLARALTVRSVLISQGVASVRIYVKALGALGAGIADGPPDRVDIVVANPPRPPGTAAAPSQKAAP